LGGGANSTLFWQTQCKSNPPMTGILQKLIQYYAFLTN